MAHRFKIGSDKRREMVSLIKDYFHREREIELGDLAAGFILDFFIGELAMEFYNQGIHDAYRYMTRLVEDVLSLQKM